MEILGYKNLLKHIFLNHIYIYIYIYICTTQYLCYFSIYTTANSFGLGLLSDGSGDIAILLLITLLFILTTLSLLPVSVEQLVSLLECTKDFRRCGWRFFKSESFRGFRRNSSAPSCKHLSIIDSYISSQGPKYVQEMRYEPYDKNKRNEIRTLYSK